MVAGIAATTLMTVFVLVIRLITGKQINVIRILGTMLTASTTTDGECPKKVGILAAGIIAHYAVGLFFSIVYIWLWTHRIIKTDWVTTTVLGFLTGLLAITVWRLYFSIHAHPPRVPLRLFLVCIFGAHVVFAWTERWIFV
jgi:putative exporter of polyketide antibiotics